MKTLSEIQEEVINKWKFFLQGVNWLGTPRGEIESFSEEFLKQSIQLAWEGGAKYGSEVAIAAQEGAKDQLDMLQKASFIAGLEKAKGIIGDSIHDNSPQANKNLRDLYSALDQEIASHQEDTYKPGNRIFNRP